MTERIDPDVEVSIRRRQTLRVIAIAVVVLIVVALAIDNRQRVAISYLVGDADAPLFLAMVAALGIGWLGGWLVTAMRHRGRE